MKGQKDNINNFFIEIIIVILFFAIAATIIVRIFATSISNNDFNDVCSKAIINSGSIIDVYKSGASIDESIKMIINDKYKFNKSNNSYEVNIDKNMKYSKKGKIKVIIEEDKELTKAGQCKTIKLKYVYRNREIYTIEGKKYEEK